MGRSFQRALMLAVLLASQLTADIFRWDNQQLIPGTEGLTVEPGAVLSGLDLQYAVLENVTNVDFTSSNLAHARLDGSFSGTKLNDATIDNIEIGIAVSGLPLSLDQLYSTRSYQLHQLSGIKLDQSDFVRIDFSSGDFRQQDLSNAKMNYTVLDSADFNQADLAGIKLVDVWGTGADFSSSNLAGAALDSAIFDNANFTRANLAGAGLTEARLTNANFTDAIINDVDFGGSSLTEQQLQSTASFQSGNLRGTSFFYAFSVAGWNLSGQDLSYAAFDYMTSTNLESSQLVGADLTGAIVDNANLRGANLGNANLEFLNGLATAQLVDAKYNQWTRLPEGFDAASAGMILEPSPTGDFNADLLVDSADIDFLGGIVSGRLPAQYRRSWLPDSLYDFDNDAKQSMSDYYALVNDVLHTSVGDADLNGMFDSGDLVRVFTAGEYEDEKAGNSGWADGDWNADGDFDSGDLVVAFQHGTYEQGEPAMVHAVPEPSTFITLAISLLFCAKFRKRFQLACVMR
ncbi:MAG: pentapeptide repeat-containing protein [Planctomycetales bacterium]|nr:pentapeptide repeat-containing protein [Planctomycetales bacterium]